MVQDNIISARAYYQAMNDRDLPGMAKYLHSHAQVISPMGTITGEKAVLDGAEGFMTLFKTLTIRASFGLDDQVMLVYDFVDCPMPTAILRAAALMTFKDGLIIRNELFFDTQTFVKKPDFYDTK
jgi:hypothetical protein